MKIPQQPELSAQVCGARAKVRRFHSALSYGYVWVCLEEPLAGNGVFTAALLRGMAGEAGVLDGYVLMHSLARYVQDSLGRWRRRRRRS